MVVSWFCFLITILFWFCVFGFFYILILVFNFRCNFCDFWFWLGFGYDFVVFFEYIFFFILLFCYLYFFLLTPFLGACSVGLAWQRPIDIGVHRVIAPFSLPFLLLLLSFYCYYYLFITTACRYSTSTPYYCSHFATLPVLTTTTATPTSFPTSLYHYC